MQPTEEIKNRLNIVELVQSYVRLEKAGNYWKAPCPFHQERTPSFVVNEERNMWHCFGCNKGGDAFAFIMEIENINFREALEMLADRAGVELPRYNQESYSQEKSLKDRLSEALELSTKFYEKQLWEGEGKKTMLPYLKDRGLTEESIRTFRLGYAPQGWSHVSDFLLSKKFTEAELISTGLSLKKNGRNSVYDRFRDRIMFPIENSFGKVIGYSARMAPGGDESQAKYINTPESPLYHKSDVLYGIAHAKNSIKEKKNAILVEGNMDVIALHQVGFTNTLAVSGTALTQEQLRILKRYSDSLALFFDMDSAGQKAARKSTELALKNDFQVALVQLPGGKDAADMIQNDADLLIESIEKAEEAPAAFLQSLLLKHDAKSAEGKKHILNDFSTLIANMNSHVAREHWIHALSQKLETSESSVRADMQGKISQSEKVLNKVEEKQEYMKPESRSEILREEYISLLLTLPGQWTEEDLRLNGTVKEFIGRHPLHFYIVQAGSSDPLSLVQEKELQELGSKLLFQVSIKEEALKMLDTDLNEYRKEQLKKLGDILEEEVVDRPRLQELQALLSDARKNEDRQEEQKLLEEFTRLSIRLANKAG